MGTKWARNYPLCICVFLFTWDCCPFLVAHILSRLFFTRIFVFKIVGILHLECYFQSDWCLFLFIACFDVLSIKWIHNKNKIYWLLVLCRFPTIIAFLHFSSMSWLCRLLYCCFNFMSFITLMSFSISCRIRYCRFIDVVFKFVF